MKFFGVFFRLHHQFPSNLSNLFLPGQEDVKRIQWMREKKKKKSPDLIKTIKQMEWYAHESESLSNSVCPRLCNTMNCSPTGSSVHGNLQTRILECAAIPFSRASNLGLLHCRQILYCLSHQGSPEVFPDKLDSKFYKGKDHAYCTHACHI